jgi:hypothetical protein
MRKAEDASELLQQRSISENIRQLLKDRGLWFKADYSGMMRGNMSDIEQLRLLFTESALHFQIDRRMFQGSFRLLKSEFFRSGVVRDVYDQTLNGADRKGGYFISVLQAQ